MLKEIDRERERERERYFFKVSGPVPITLEKFENATLVTQLSLPSILIRYENGVFRNRSSKGGIGRGLGNSYNFDQETLSPTLSTLKIGGCLKVVIGECSISLHSPSLRTARFLSVFFGSANQITSCMHHTSVHSPRSTPGLVLRTVLHSWSR